MSSLRVTKAKKIRNILFFTLLIFNVFLFFPTANLIKNTWKKFDIKTFQLNIKIILINKYVGKNRREFLKY